LLVFSVLPPFLRSPDRFFPGSICRRLPEPPTYDPVTLLFLLAPIALVPAIVAWVAGHRLIKLADDPVLAERLLATRNRNAFVCTLCLAAMLPFGTTHLAWAVPLLIASRMAVGYRVRKALYGETWHFGSYMSFFGRLAIAAFGFWAVVGMLPNMALLAGRWGWLLAVALGALVWGWGTAYGRVFAAVLRARPVGDPAIRSLFTQMSAQCALENVTLKQVDVGGGVFANAVALPSIAHPIVLVSSTLVERLDEDETAAILAHELAHIEHSTPRVLRTASFVMYGLIVASTLVAPLVRLVPQFREALLILWPAALIVALVLRARHRQKHETESDLRAVAITGNPDALVRALTKLHAFARVPRRWDSEFEKRATHPSLARRIQAIHAAAGTVPASLAEPAVFISPDGKRSATIHADRVEFNEGSAGCHAIGYGLLAMLRVDVKSSGAPRLVAVDGSNRRWDILLQPGDIARAQAALDVVDGRLRALPASPQPSFAAAQWLALAALVTAVAAGQLSVSLVAWIGVIQPSAPLLAAVGAATVGAAAVILRDHFLRASDPIVWSALALLGYGIGLIVLAAFNRHHPSSPRARQITAALAAGALIAGGLVAAGGVDTMSLHRSARQWPSAAVLVLALAGALAFTRRPRIRFAAVPVACFGVAVIFLGSAAFLERFVADAFLVPTEPLTVTTVTGRPVSELMVPFEVIEARLSPTGRLVALSSEDDDEQVTIHAGPAAGPLVSFDADEALFVDDARLLLLERQRSATLLRLLALDRVSREVWSRRLPLWAVHLSFDRATATWHLLGRNEADDIIRVSGRIGEDDVREEQWSGRGLQDADVRSVSNGAVLAIETRYTSSRFENRLFGAWSPLIPSVGRSESRFWSIDDNGRRSIFATSRLDLVCQTTSGDEDATLCTAFDGMRTRFFAVDPATRRLAALASVSGRFYLRGEAGGGWLAGWWERSLVLVRASTGEAIRIADGEWRTPILLAKAEKLFGAVFAQDRGSVVRLYSMERQD
jgi:Zn-dependent protease with chaperone function